MARALRCAWLCTAQIRRRRSAGSIYAVCVCSYTHFVTGPSYVEGAWRGEMDNLLVYIGAKPVTTRPPRRRECSLAPLSSFSYLPSLIELCVTKNVQYSGGCHTKRLQRRHLVVLKTSGRDRAKPVSFLSFVFFHCDTVIRGIGGRELFEYRQERRCGCAPLLDKTGIAPRIFDKRICEIFEAFHTEKGNSICVSQPSLGIREKEIGIFHKQKCW